MDTNQMITSKELLGQTGLSRATLNNYIKLGILPRPLVRNPGPGVKGIKQIGFFPVSVLDRLKLVKRYKRQGGTMEEIARKLQENAPVFDFQLKKDELTEARNKDTSAIGPSPASGRPGLTLTIEDMSFPSFLVNHNFEIEWINPLAEEHIFNRPVSKISELEARNIFKLFFSWEFSSHLKNWQNVIASHFSFVKSRLPKNHLRNLYQGISDSEIRFLETLYDDETLVSGESPHSTTLQLVKKDGTLAPYQVHSMYFREGIFFAYVPVNAMVNDVMEMLSQRGKIITELLKHRMPSLVSLCVLVADLQNSVKISAELLPEEYFELINQLWKNLQGTFDKYDGIYGKHAGDGMLYYFIKKPSTSYIMNAMCCALEIKKKMKEFNHEWKRRKGWLNDLFINIGVNEGQEFFGAVSSSSHIEFTALGDSINYAGRLSDFARFGSIWTTKNVISKLRHEDMSHIRFGVYRTQNDREIFIENSFSRVIDLLGKDVQKSSKFMDIATVPVTEVIEGKC
ncbi:MAG: adenylate/guanylate cyclase domain-containing protein [Desulfobacterales bacterium]|nr:adenylate/guanylate cyclase domain-containing protein [Desulfobacterales bacterium]